MRTKPALDGSLGRQEGKEKRRVKQAHIGLPRLENIFFGIERGRKSRGIRRKGALAMK